MKRARYCCHFIRSRGLWTSSILAGLGLLLTWVLMTGLGAPIKRDKDLLKGFIIADVHFGWQNEKQQPPPEVIREMMGRIKKRFTDLDVFLDTGDAYHGNAQDEHRAQWTDIISGGCGLIPFFYTVGNHELGYLGHPGDPEQYSAKFGSLPCRLYYSFDLKGIHFISLPELMFCSYITQESIDWVKLDLALNKDKTTIILSHNSIGGTTEYQNDPGYRKLANSKQVLDLLDQHPNVLAWMHGHNHTYEMVQKGDKLFVSNGRFGGFIPREPEKWAARHLGGIYFEVGADHLTARGYSASEERFLDELGYAHLSQTLRVPTSFDHKAPACFSYGMGGSRDGQRLSSVQHYAVGRGKRELFIAGTDGPIINENPDLSVYTKLHLPLPVKQCLPGYRLRPHLDALWKWTDPGIRLSPRAKPEESSNFVSPGPFRGQRCYYRCPPGRTYRATIDIESPAGGQQFQMRCRVHDRQRDEVARIDGPVWKLSPGKQTRQMDFKVPDLAEVDSIYKNPDSDNVFHVLVEADFTNLLTEVFIKRFALKFADAEGLTVEPAVTINGKRFTHNGKLAPNEYVRFELPQYNPARSVYEIAASGNRRLSWLVRQTDVAWQVRNASVTQKRDHLLIGPLRNTFSPREEIVIVPLVPTKNPYVHRLRHVNRARISPWTGNRNRLRIEILEALGPAEIEILTDRKPKRVTGSEVADYSKGRLVLSAKEPGTTTVQF